jgi:vancomycin resistance protein VanJ
LKLFLRRTFILLTGLYGLGVSVYLGARLVIGETRRAAAFINTGLHLLLMPSLVLMPLLVFWRRWKLALLLLAPFVKFMLAYGKLFLWRKPVKFSGAEVVLTVLTYNLHSEHIQFEPMLAIIRAANADVVAVQELTREAADCLEIALQAEYPYRWLDPQNPVNHYGGRGVLSRYPLAGGRMPPLSPVPTEFQRLELDVKGIQIVVYNVHLPSSFAPWVRRFNTRPRAQYAARLAEQVARETAPTILLGDFNLVDQSDDYRPIARRFTDSYLEAGMGMGFTYPDYDTGQARSSRRLPPFVPPLTRIDFVFHNAGLRAIEARVWPTAGVSDHRPLLVRLALPVMPAEIS